jgi:hypothetical protein
MHLIIPAMRPAGRTGAWEKIGVTALRGHEQTCNNRPYSGDSAGKKPGPRIE